MTHYAHSLPGNPDRTKWETMSQHEQQVASLCRLFLTRIHQDLDDWGDVLGRWHDLGKYSLAFQQYISNANETEASAETRSGKVNHSSAGAQHAANTLGKIGHLLAYCIAGHHAGLPDWISRTGSPKSGLQYRLEEKIEDFSAAPIELLAAKPLAIPKLPFDPNCLGFQLSLLVRMCFSALCDADFLTTEAFMSHEQARHRPSKNVSIEQMSRSLADHVEKLQSSGLNSEVNRVRAEIQQMATQAATAKPGLFSLNVPTGGGKTLASLTFALEHARQNGLDRVIYAIPFTSIIEQTSDVFRNVFQALGDDAVLEHHSNLDPERETIRARLASENWDAPLVVTTNIQFFESLFANKTSRARKLHRIARSVIILDEVQTLPIELLEPCLAVLKCLAELFGCTIVLCTATQPALDRRESFPIGFEPSRITPIVPDPAAIHSRMRRVETTVLGQIDLESLVSRISKHRQTLCIVNTRARAAEIYQSLAERTVGCAVFHLSTFMCAAHRTSVLNQIRQHLQVDQPCHVVSTQLIEAGVDVDFPVVYRAIAGLDSIAQAAGRCNREGRRERGDLFVFDLGDRLRGMLRQTADKAREVIPQHNDILSLDAIEHYFRLHYWQQSEHCDEHRVMECFDDVQGKRFDFRTGAERFQMIEDASRSVFVPWSTTGELIEEELRSAWFIDQRLRRKANRFLVPIYENAFLALAGSDIDVEAVEGIPLLLNRDLYDEHLGLRLDRAGQHDPGGLII